MKIHQFRGNIVIRKGTETLTLEIDETTNEVNIWATDQSGGYTIGEFRFLNDRVERVGQ